MKTLLLALLTLAIAAPVFAADIGLSGDDAQGAVVREAHRYLAKSAPDFGGEIHAPCETSFNGDAYDVTCKGIERDTVGGDGFIKNSFACVGHFNEGHDGLFYQVGEISCN
jgi:hypothetical protein